MNFFDAYRHFEGSHGKIRLRLNQAILDQLCARVVHKFAMIKSLRIAPTGENRFRIRAELSSRPLQFLGTLGLNSLREDGIAVELTYRTATRKDPTIEGALRSTMVGMDIAIPILVKMINHGLDAGEVFEVMESDWSEWAEGRAFVHFHPFRLAAKFLPQHIADHLTRLKWQADTDGFLIDLSWQHGEPVPLQVIRTGETNG